MKTLYPVEIIIDENNKVLYNYKGKLYTKAEFEEKYLNIYKEPIQIVHDNEKRYWYLWNLAKNEQVTDDDGNPIHFNSIQAAETFLKGDQE